MFESIVNFFKKIGKQDKEPIKSKDAAKERLHLVLMQDRANVSADFLEMMKQEIIEVIKKYIDVDENAIDVRLTNKENLDGTTGAPALYANIPIVSIKEESKSSTEKQTQTAKVEKKEQNKQNKEKKQPEEVKKEDKEKKTTAVEKVEQEDKENKKEISKEPEEKKEQEEVKPEEKKEEADKEKKTKVEPEVKKEEKSDSKEAKEKTANK